jgi:hypothetical protein
VYRVHRITIEIGDVTIGSVSSSGLVTASTTARWGAHEGFNPISDSTFFMRMGLAHEANESGQWVRTRKKDAKWGMILSGGGIVGMLASAGPATRGSWTPFWVSTGVSCVGIGFLYAAVAHAGNRYPASTVTDLVDPYNARLLNRVQRGEMTSMRGSPESFLIGLRVPVR